MKRSILAILAVALMAGVAAAGPIVAIDFASLPWDPVTGTETNILSTAYSFPDLVQFQYGPQGSPICGWDLAAGYGFSGSCIGAQMDPFGVRASTDGNLIVDFPTTVYNLWFDYYMLALVPLDPAAPPFGVEGFFTGGGYASVAGDAGSFSFSGPFNHAELSFSPAGGFPDPITLLPVYGQTEFAITAMSYNPVPEPGTFGLLATALLGFFAVLKRKGR